MSSIPITHMKKDFEQHRLSSLSNWERFENSRELFLSLRLTCYVEVQNSFGFENLKTLESYFGLMWYINKDSNSWVIFGGLVKINTSKYLDTTLYIQFDPDQLRRLINHWKYLRVICCLGEDQIIFDRNVKSPKDYELKIRLKNSLGQKAQTVSWIIYPETNTNPRQLKVIDNLAPNPFEILPIEVPGRMMDIDPMDSMNYKNIKMFGIFILNPKENQMQGLYSMIFNTKIVLGDLHFWSSLVRINPHFLNQDHIKIRDLAFRGSVSHDLIIENLFDEFVLSGIKWRFLSKTSFRTYYLKRQTLSEFECTLCQEELFDPQEIRIKCQPKCWNDKIYCRSCYLKICYKGRKDELYKCPYCQIPFTTCISKGLEFLIDLRDQDNHTEYLGLFLGPN